MFRASGRLLPGVQKRARFRTSAGGDLIQLELDSPATKVTADVELTDEFRNEFWGDDLHAASEFFRCGSVGWLPSHAGTPEARQIDAIGWSVVPATALRVELLRRAASRFGGVGLRAGAAECAVRVECAGDRPSNSRRRTATLT